VDIFRPLAKVRVSGSYPVFRSKISGPELWKLRTWPSSGGSILPIIAYHEFRMEPVGHVLQRDADLAGSGSAQTLDEESPTEIVFLCWLRDSKRIMKGAAKSIYSQGDVKQRFSRPCCVTQLLGELSRRESADLGPYEFDDFAIAQTGSSAYRGCEGGSA
jgi:hypothetical protein